MRGLQKGIGEKCDLKRGKHCWGEREVAIDRGILCTWGECWKTWGLLLKDANEEEGGHRVDV